VQGLVLEKARVDGQHADAGGRSGGKPALPRHIGNECAGLEHEEDGEESVLALKSLAVLERAGHRTTLFLPSL